MDKKEKKNKKRKTEEESASEREEMSPRVINDEDVDMEIELEKDTLPPYLPAIQGNYVFWYLKHSLKGFKLQIHPIELACLTS